MNIFVSNLSFKFNDDSVRELFQNYGEVNSCKVITDKFSGKSRGFGFVEMNNDIEGQKAIDALNNSEQDGRNIIVNIAKPRTENRDRSSGRGEHRNNHNRW